MKGLLAPQNTFLDTMPASTARVSGVGLKLRFELEVRVSFGARVGLLNMIRDPRRGEWARRSRNYQSPSKGAELAAPWEEAGEDQQCDVQVGGV